MKKEYDIVYLTNTPSFYKLNLCEELGKRGIKLLLVLYGYGSEAVNTAIDSRSWHFDYTFIHSGDSHKRNFFKSFYRLLKLMRGIKTQCVLYAGWMAWEYNIYSFLSPKRKNAVICEKSIYDISMDGIRGAVKKLIIGRMSSVLPSGKPHLELFDKIGYKGRHFITGGVGLIHKPHRRPKALPQSSLKYLYVGRLIPEKNIELLIEAFNSNHLPLTIVGAGELEEKLKAMASPNIEFRGFISNDHLGDVYQEHDVFILPSVQEAWGLVVEEALYWGLPVIVSDRVGSGPDLVADTGAGEIFDANSAESLQCAIDKVSSDYGRYHAAAAAIDFDARDRAQIQAYIDLLK